MSVKTCPKCGRLVAPQQPRCRGCDTYLHGSRLEGALSKLLPASLRAAPATAMIFVAIAATYLVMAVAALPASPLAFSEYTLRHAGAAGRIPLEMGEWWRLVTSIFVHHDVVHLGFNLYCLALVGPIVEQFFGKKRFLALYLVVGVASMAVSDVWYADILDRPYVSAGASGAVCGLIGLAWMGADRWMPKQPHIAEGMKRWAVMLAIWGFLVPGINNAAHAGGFVVGLALGRVVPVGPLKSAARRRLASALALVSILTVVACAGWSLRAGWGHPWSLPADVRGSAVLGFDVSGDRPAWRDSSQYDALMACQRVYIADRPVETVRAACEYALRVAPYQPVPAYEFLEQIERDEGNDRRANRLAHARAVVRSLVEID